MKKIVLGVAAAVLGATLVICDVEAARVGGGRSAGAQRSITSTPPAQAPAEAAKSEAAASAPAADTPIAFPERIELEFDIAKSADHAPMGRLVHRFERDAAAPEERLERHGIYGFPRGFLARRPRRA